METALSRGTTGPSAPLYKVAQPSALCIATHLRERAVVAKRGADVVRARDPERVVRQVQQLPPSAPRHKASGRADAPVVRGGTAGWGGVQTSREWHFASPRVRRQSPAGPAGARVRGHGDRAPQARPGKCMRVRGEGRGVSA